MTQPYEDISYTEACAIRRKALDNLARAHHMSILWQEDVAFANKVFEYLERKRNVNILD